MNPQNQTKQKTKTQQNLQTKMLQTNKTPPNHQNPNKGKTQPTNTKTPNPQTNKTPKPNKQQHAKVARVINSTSQWVFRGERVSKIMRTNSCTLSGKKVSQIVGQIYFKSILKTHTSPSESTMYFLSAVLTKT